MDLNVWDSLGRRKTLSVTEEKGYIMAAVIKCSGTFRSSNSAKSFIFPSIFPGVELLQERICSFRTSFRMGSFVTQDSRQKINKVASFCKTGGWRITAMHIFTIITGWERTVHVSRCPTCIMDASLSHYVRN